MGNNTYSYDDLGRVATVQVQGGPLRSYTYDTMGRLEGVSVGSNTFAYTFKGPANPLIDTLVRPNGAVTQYQYNSLNQLSGVINKKSDSTLINSYIYSYDTQDQRDSETITGGLPAVPLADRQTDSTFNNLNQLLSTINPDQDFSYDDDGNMAGGHTKDGYSFNAVYDADSRLIGIFYTDGAGINQRVEYIYRWDSFLAVILKYENDSLVEEARVVRDGHLALQDRDQNNTVIREYTWGANLGGGIGGLLELTQGGSAYSYLFDGKGNVVSVIDSSQADVAQYRYNSFGKLVNSAGSLEQPFRFSTKRYDDGLGLNYYGYRFYNPQVERWMNRDPLGEAGGINLYGFVLNDPVNFVDPKGLNPLAGVLTGTAIGGPVGGIIGFGIGVYAGQQIWDNWFANEGEPDPSAPIPDDPSGSPGEDWTWKGSGPPESGKGNWVNDKTGQNIHPDLNHPAPKGPHWGLTNPDGSKWDFFPNGDGWKQCK